MPLVLELDDTHEANYVGNIGKTVQLGIVGVQGSALIVAGAYNGALIVDDSFVIVAGVKDLAVVIHNTVEGDWTQIIEESKAPTEQQNLRRNFKFESKWPGVGFKIKGK